jgi:hypothetical protein
VQEWACPEAALAPHYKCGMGQDVSILAEQKGAVSTLCPEWGTLHEPCDGPHQLDIRPSSNYN